jgi:hypothetical protein
MPDGTSAFDLIVLKDFPEEGLGPRSLAATQKLLSEDDVKKV